MIFFYNFETYHHKTIELHDHTCPKCKNKGTMKMIFNQYYTKSIFLSTFPFRKFAVLYCSVCDYEIPSKRWDDDLKIVSKEGLKTLKTPKELRKGYFRLAFLFFAPIIFFALFLFYQVKFNGAKSVYNSANNQPTNSNYIARESKPNNLQENDLYFGIIVRNAEDRNLGVIKIIATNDETTSVKISDETYQEAFSPMDIKSSDIDQSKFNSPTKMIETQAFLTTLRLLENEKKAPENELGKMYFKIAN